MELHRNQAEIITKLHVITSKSYSKQQNNSNTMTSTNIAISCK